MTHILVIDEPINHQLVGRACVPLQSEIHFAADGNMEESS